MSETERAIIVILVVVFTWFWGYLFGRRQEYNSLREQGRIKKKERDFMK